MQNPTESDEGSRELVGARYEVLERLGKGGMAVVDRVFDHSTNTEVALKRLRLVGDERKQRKALTLFEREFHTLSQLAHPRVVQVYDYGVDGETAYYTMELLDGGDLHARTPVAWQTACKLIRDVCSVLALLHSRRLVHRDVSPRNIRCTEDGLAKLIDFGAMVPMGAGKQPVGTPALVPPEAVDMETLDARADLYSLGATLYYALVGRNAYPARDFKQLRHAWETPPNRPSELVPDIPNELDALVMRLLSLDPVDRPVNAAEVMERLGAIAELPSDEQLHVSHAYLNSPTLVGRDGLLSRVRKKLERAREARGVALMALGDPGAGRSRFLDACLLEAKLGGATVARVDSSDGHSGEYGTVRALGSRLLHAAPELARSCAQDDVAVLGHVIPELTRGTDIELRQFDGPQQRRPAIQQALRRWLVALSKEKPLVVGVDDVDRVDEPSAALIALLAHDAGDHRIAVMATAEKQATEAKFGPLKLLSDVSTSIEVPALRQRDTESLLRSVFGDAPNAQLVAHKLHRISEGNPRDVMQLAQHLVEEDTIRYEAGSWVLPAEIDDAGLPSNITQALTQRARTLGREALELARPWALAPEFSMSPEDLQALTAHEDPARTMQALDELLAVGVLRGSGNRFELAQRGWVAPLLADAGDDEMRDVHQRLSAFFAKQGDDFRAAQHLLYAGDYERGLDALVQHASESKARTDEDPDAYTRLLASLPSDWLETYQFALRLCRERDRPKRDLYVLLIRMSSLPTSDHDPESIVAMMQQLEWASGLDLYYTLDDSMDAQQHLDETFKLAQQRYEQTPEADRIEEPVAAIRPLARACLQAVGIVATRLDLELWERIPSLKPFEPLSPALWLVNELIQGNGQRITAHTAEAIAIYEALLERANHSDRAGLDETYHRYTVFGITCGLGLIEAPIGLDKALDRARVIEDNPTHRVNAVLIRMIYHLWQGQASEADECKEQVEVLRIENSPRQWFEGGHLMGELTAHAAADDLVRIRQTLADVAVMADKFPGWGPVLHLARGEYHRIRGAYSAALQELEHAVSQAPPGRHQLWAEIAGAHVRVLGLLERHDEAVGYGEQYLQAAGEHDLGYQTNFIRMALAPSLAHVGQRERAESLADDAVRHLEELGAGALLRGLAHEARARVALRVEDEDTFEQQARECATLFKGASNRALSAKYKRLLDEAQQARVQVPDTLAGAADTSSHSSLVHTLDEELDKISSATDRAYKALELMLRESHAVGGALYAVRRDGPQLVASESLPDDRGRLDDFVREELDKELEEADKTITGTMGAPTVEAPENQLELDELMVRTTAIAHSTGGQFHVTGMAVFIVEPDAAFVPPIELAAQLSRYWYGSGDATRLGSQLEWSRTGSRTGKDDGQLVSGTTSQTHPYAGTRSKPPGDDDQQITSSRTRGGGQAIS